MAGASGKKPQLKNFIIDVDGVLNTGQFLYSARGKEFKIFGPDDSDGLSLLKHKMNIHMVSGDKRGFEITKKRVVDDMHFPLDLVNTFDRVAWIKDKYKLEESVYMGDGIYDVLVFREVAYSIAPANAFYLAKKETNFVTNSRGGEGAVAEACIHLLDKFFAPYDIYQLASAAGSGAWPK